MILKSYPEFLRSAKKKYEVAEKQIEKLNKKYNIDCKCPTCGKDVKICIIHECFICGAVICSLCVKHGCCKKCNEDIL